MNCASRGIPLLEDVCESHGATFEGRKLGTFGLASNFSFYYAHHLSTIEGGMVCTNNADLYETVRMLRSHGLVRELDSDSRKREYCGRVSRPEPRVHLRLSRLQRPQHRDQRRHRPVAAAPAGRRHRRRTENLRLFLEQPRPDAYRTDFATEGSSNYAFTLILAEPDAALCERVMTSAAGSRRRIPPRHGRAAATRSASRTSGACSGRTRGSDYPRADHVHFYGFYIGNYPSLEREQGPAAVRPAERPGNG